MPDSRAERLIFHWKVKVNLRPKSKSESSTNPIVKVKSEFYKTVRYIFWLHDQKPQCQTPSVNFPLESESESQTNKQK